MGARVIFLPSFHLSRRSLVPVAGPGMPVPSPRLLFRALAIGACLVVLSAASAYAQLGVADTGFETCHQWRYEKAPTVVPGKAYVKLEGAVECATGDMRVFADQLEYWADTHKVVLTGNVTFRDKNTQISADRADFNSETRLGTFYNASGFAQVADVPKKDVLGGQEPDVYFYGDTVEKIGVDKYRITHGGFTTCVQPTPRWQITSGSVTLRVEHYAFLTNALLKAKGIPVFYLPALYYPMQRDDRATGILMPTYGTSTLKGFTLSNAFFWAISRSQDATFMHDWFTQRGQGFGSEYRFVSGPGSSGYFKFYNLREHESTYTDSSGNETQLPARTSYEVRSSVSQSLGRRWSARGRVDYFTDITVNQTYNTDIYDTSRSSRYYGGGISGSLGGFSINGSYDRTEYFAGASDSTVTGSSPRISVARNEKPLFGAPLYFSVNTEFTGLVRQSRSDGEVTDDRGLNRFDVSPVIRVPFTKLRFLTINSSAAWRGTWWSRSLSTDGTVLDQGINRGYFDLQSRVTGPVLNRVWNTPNSGYATKWKHTVEPFYNLQYTTAVDNFDQIIQLDSVDYIVGGTLRMDYGVTNRLLAKRTSGGANGSAREVVSVGINQTYYTDARASQYDYNYTTSFSAKPPSNFSPVRITVRGTPGDQINGTLRLEYDTDNGGVQSIAANGQVAIAEWLNVNAGFSQRRFASTDITQAYQRDNYLNAAARLQTPSNRVGGTYTFNYDIGRSTMLSSRIVGYYNAQCCGFAVEYQTYNFPQISTLYPVPQDRRFNFSFTLAGLGTFSNFFGAFGGGGMGR
jgi:LPS-assembly protein